MRYPNFSGSDSQNLSHSSLPASRWILKLGVQLAAFSLLTTLLPVPPASALRFTRNRDSYSLCAQELLVAGVPPEAASAACAAALHPADISECVTHIRRKTEIPATEALLSCRRVRRPYELANCVVDINTQTKTQAAAPVSTLEFCRRSLLPERFAQCVVGLSRRINFPTEQLMTTCIDARNELGQLEPPASPPASPNPFVPPPAPAPVPAPPVR